MTGEPVAPKPSIQFDTAVAADRSRGACSQCKQPVADTYYTAARAVVCVPCKTRIAQTQTPRTSVAQIARAAVFGLGGAVAGAIIYYVVLAATGYEIALVAIAVGFIVGRAVQLGARQRGLAFQIVALVLTYIGIAAGTATSAFKNIGHRSDSTTVALSQGSQQSTGDSGVAVPQGEPAGAPADSKGDNPVWALIALAGVVLIIPVVAAFGNLPGSLLTAFIIAVGLRQAWVMNRAPPSPVFHGPFRVAPASSETPTI